MLLATHQQVCIDVACIHDLLIRQKVMLGEILLNGRCHFHILHIGYRRLHRYNELRHGSGLGVLSGIQCTRFSQMNFVPQPRHLPLFARACLGIIGGTNDPLA